MKMKPISDHIVLKRDAPKEMTAGGIIIPEIARETLHSGVIKFAGQGLTRKDGSVKPLEVKVGDRVLFSCHAGMEFELAGEKLVIMHEADLFGVVQN